MKKNSTNYAFKILGLTVMALVAMLKPAFCQVPAPDFDLNTYTMAVSSNQQVNFRLPKDIRSGDQITGTVIDEKKSVPGEYNNSSRLEGVVIEINGKQTKIGNRLISFLVPAGLTSLPFLLKNSAGQVIDRGQIPVGISAPDPMPHEDYSLNNIRADKKPPVNVSKFIPEAVSQPGQTLRVTGSFDGNAANTNVSLSGQACEIIAESPRMSYVQVPQNAVAGVSDLTIQENNQKEEHKVNVATLNLSANKTSLTRGQKATITVTVNGLENLDLNNNNFKIRLENQSPQTISFMKAGSNVITKEINAGSVKNGVYEFSTRIIALTAGVFTVSANITAPEKSDCTIAYETEWASIIQQEQEGMKRCKETGGTGLSDCELKVAAIIKDLKSKCQQVYLDCIKNK